MQMQKPFRPIFFSDLLRQILLSWLTAVTMEYFSLPEAQRGIATLEGLAQMSLGRVLLMTFGLTAVLFALARFWDLAKIERWSLVGIFAVLCCGVLKASFLQSFVIACVLMIFGFVCYGSYGWDSSPEPEVIAKKSHPVFLWLTVALGIGFFLFVSIWTVSRVLSFSTPTFDFGIFAQMFHNMKESGLPMTTLERDGLLSHFHVHMSPIYYLMLPFYCLVPTPATLQVLQAAVLASSVIPLWKIGKHHGLDGLQRMLLCAVLLLFPAFSGGTSYDIHENCFLAPLILWLLYGIDRKNIPLITIFACLTLLVKEDAAVYVAVIALWVIVKTLLRYKKGDYGILLTGIFLLGGSLLWFSVVTGYLAEIGDGVMTYRYSNFIYDGSASLVTVIEAVLLNPMKAVYECADPNKLWFMGITMLPLLGLPLLTRRYERYILLIPYVLVNLMSDYQYQHDIFFQYTFGSTACLLYLTAVNLADLKIDYRRTSVLLSAAAICLVCFSAVVVPTATYYPKLCKQYAGYYEKVEETLSVIPEGASVSATTFYTTYLSQREVLYDIRYASKDHVLQTEYVAMHMTSTGDFTKYNTDGKTNGYDNLVKLLEENGYELVAEYPDVLTVYKKA